MNNDLISRKALKAEINKTILEIADTPMWDDYASKLALKLGKLMIKKIDEMQAAIINCPNCGEKLD